jgi:hypothetical protein
VGAWARGRFSTKFEVRSTKDAPFGQVESGKVKVERELNGCHRELHGWRSDLNETRLLQSLCSMRLPRRPQYTGRLAMTIAFSSFFDL